MTAMLLSVFLASILGSTHCAGMCGAFVMLAVSDFKGRPGTPPLALASYHLGRLTTYTLLGSIAGVVGSWATSTSLPPSVTHWAKPRSP